MKSLPTFRLLLALFWLAIPIGRVSAQSSEETVQWINEKIKTHVYLESEVRYSDDFLSANVSDSDFSVSLDNYGALTVQYIQHFFSQTRSGRTSNEPVPQTFKMDRWGKYPVKLLAVKPFNTTTSREVAPYVSYAVVIADPANKGRVVHIPCESADVGERIIKALKHLADLAADKMEPF
jgi:hypothetical protein